jgi:antitoxin component of RelBE/YafQ-DinJ toxin-antitoxin module
MKTKPKSLLQTQVEDELKKKIAQIAKRERITMSACVRRILWSFVESKNAN